MQKVIVTSSAFTGYSTIFNLDGDNLDLSYRLTPQKVSSSNDLDLTVLPFDIKYIVLERLVLGLLKEGQIKKALNTLFVSNSAACCIFYTKYIGYYDLSRLQIINHLISMFYLINDIHTHLYYDSTSLEELCLSLFCRHDIVDIKKDKKWPFGALSHSFMDAIPSLLQARKTKEEKMVKVVTGSSYADIIWLSGVEKDGVILTNYLKGPIVILELYTTCHGINQTILAERTPFLQRFVKLLKLALGEYSGVYTTFPIEGFLSIGLVSEVV